MSRYHLSLLSVNFSLIHLLFLLIPVHLIRFPSIPFLFFSFLSILFQYFPLLISSLFYTDLLLEYHPPHYLPNRMDDISSVRTVSVTFNNGRSYYTFKQSDVKLTVVQKSMYGKYGRCKVLRVFQILLSCQHNSYAYYVDQCGQFLHSMRTYSPE